FVCNIEECLGLEMMCASADASLRMKTATVTAKHAAEAYLGLSPILIGLQIIVVVVFIPLAMRGGADFRQLYTAGYMVRAGYSSRLYDYNVQKDLQNKLVSPAQIACLLTTWPMKPCCSSPYLHSHTGTPSWYGDVGSLCTAS